MTVVNIEIHVPRCVWGHHPEHPRLELEADPIPRTMPGYIQAGARHWRAYYPHRCNRKRHPELLHDLRGRDVKKTGERAVTFLRSRKRSDSAELHVRLAQWLLKHHDARSRWVGLVVGAPRGEPANLRPYRFGQIMDDLQCSEGQLKRGLRRFRAAGLIHRHQGREYDPENESLPYRGKVATIRLTKHFFVVSGCAQLREQHIGKLDRRERRERDRRDMETRGYVVQLANRLSGRMALLEKFAREIRASNPTWSTFAVDQEADRRLEEWQRHRDEARRRRPPPS